MNEAGHLGGELFPADKVPGLVKYLDRRGIYVHEAVNGSFDGVRGVMTLPRNPGQEKGLGVYKRNDPFPLFLLTKICEFRKQNPIRLKDVAKD